MDGDQKKLFGAIAGLVLALGILGFQVFQRIDRDARGEVATDFGMMEEETGGGEVYVAEAWSPEPTFAGMTPADPFLQPTKSAAQRGPRAKIRSTARLSLTGVRTGEYPTAIINNRTCRVGDDISGWIVERIERDRVSLRKKSNGKTIQLDVR